MATDATTALDDRSARREAQADDALVPRNRSVVAWAFAGFLVGTVFWHLVGFWEFLGRVVLRDAHRPTMIAKPASDVDGKLSGKIADGRTEAPVAMPGCTALVRAVAGRVTVAEPCPDDVAPMRTGNFLRRGDLAAFGPIGATLPAVASTSHPSPAAAWSTTITGSIPPPAAPRATGPN